MKPDTIFALATPMPPSGGSGIAVVRVSGPDAFGIGAIHDTPPPHKKFILADLTIDGTPIDHCGIIAFHKPHSYTGEDVIEFHLHGGLAVIRSLEDALLNLGLRPAEPGEFTRRAFLNGRIDLVQAESIAAIVGARGQAAQIEALRQREGKLSGLVLSLRSRLRDLLGRIEVDFDYPEERTDGISSSEAAEILDALLTEVRKLLSSWNKGQRLRGFRLALIGQPNVGKSSLLNALLDDDRAIVTDTPGTTRDVVSGTIDFNGVPAEILDTAGIRHISETLNTPEAEGIRRSWREVERAHVVIVVLDTGLMVTQDDVKLVRDAREITKKNDARILLVANKSDLDPAWEPSMATTLVEAQDIPSIIVSALTGEGIDRIRKKVAELLDLSNLRDEITLTEMRHVSLFKEVESILASAVSGFRSGIAQDAVATELWGADRALGRILGEGIGSADLDEIFSRFCVGK